MKTLEIIWSRWNFTHKFHVVKVLCRSNHETSLIFSDFSFSFRLVITWTMWSTWLKQSKYFLIKFNLSHPVFLCYTLSCPIVWLCIDCIIFSDSKPQKMSPWLCLIVVKLSTEFFLSLQTAHWDSLFLAVSESPCRWGKEGISPLFGCE